MSKLSHVTLRVLGTFAIEANVGRPVAISIRSRKARALLAYLAMKPDYRARREELATLFWGDNPDSLARHSLRQCLISLRQDLCLASEILSVDREAIGLRAQFVSVDARAFMSLARSAAPDGLAQAAELWRGAFLPDLALDVEEFDSWHRQEADRLSAVAAGYSRRFAGTPTRKAMARAPLRRPNGWLRWSRRARIVSVPRWSCLRAIGAARLH